MLFAATPLHLTVSTACPRPTFGPLSPPLASPSLPRQPRSPVELSCFWCDGHIILFEAFSAPAPSTAEFFRSLSPNIYPHLVPPPHHLLRYRWVTGPAGPSPSLARPRSSVCRRLNNPLGTRGPLSSASLLGAVGSSCGSTGFLVDPTAFRFQQGHYRPRPRHPRSHRFIDVPNQPLRPTRSPCRPRARAFGSNSSFAFPVPSIPRHPPPSPPSLHGASVSLKPPPRLSFAAHFGAYSIFSSQPQ